MKWIYLLLITVLVAGCGTNPMTLEEAKAKCSGTTDPHCWKNLGINSLNADMCNPSLYPIGRAEAGAKCAQAIAESIGDAELCNHPAITGNTGVEVSVEGCRKAVSGKQQKCGLTGMPCCHQRKCLDDADYCDSYYRCSAKLEEPSIPGDSMPGGVLD